MAKKVGKKIIIEYVGLPGSGKTTAAKLQQHSKNDSKFLYSTSSESFLIRTLQKLVIFLGFVLSSPKTTTEIVHAGLKDQIRIPYLFNFFVAIANIQNSNENLVFDQGLIQNLIGARLVNGNKPNINLEHLTKNYISKYTYKVKYLDISLELYYSRFMTRQSLTTTRLSTSAESFYNFNQASLLIFKDFKGVLSIENYRSHKQ